MIIYKATNKFDGKSYIGQTIKKLSFRKKQHENAKRITLFTDSIIKHGKNNFTWEVIEKCDSKEELDEMEFHYIKQYDTLCPNGYNMTLGGEGGNCGNQFTKLSKEERSKLHFLNNLSYEEREKHLNEKYRGKNNYLYRLMSEEERKKWLRKYKIGESSPSYGKKRKHTEETKKKMSKAKMGDKNPMNRPEVRKKVSDSLKGKLNSFYGKHHTEETKTKISNANSGSKNGMAKAYKITKPNGEIEMIKGILEYCRKNSISLPKLKKIYKVENIVGGG